MELGFLTFGVSFLFFVCRVAIHLARQLHQEYIQIVQVSINVVLSFLLSFFGLEDPSQSLDQADVEHPINHRTHETVPDRSSRNLPLLRTGPRRVPRQVGRTVHNVGGLPENTCQPQSISLTNKTSVYHNLVVPPYSGEKQINKVWEAGKVLNKGYQPKWRLTFESNCFYYWKQYFRTLV